VKKSDFVYGLDTHLEPEASDDSVNLFKIPFLKYRLLDRKFSEK